MREGRPDYLSRRSFLKGAGTLAATVPLGMGGAFRARPKARSRASTKIVFSMQKQEVIPYFENLVAKYAAANPGVAITLDTESNQTVDLVRNDPPDLSLNNYGIASGNYWRAGVLGSLAGTAAAANVRPQGAGADELLRLDPGDALRGAVLECCRGRRLRPRDLRQIQREDPEDLVPVRLPLRDVPEQGGDPDLRHLPGRLDRDAGHGRLLHGRDDRHLVRSQPGWHHERGRVGGQTQQDRGGPDTGQPLRRSPRCCRRSSIACFRS